MNKFKVGDRVKIIPYGSIFDNAIGTIKGIGKFDWVVLFDDNELRNPYREDGAWLCYQEELELYTMEDTKRNLLD